MSNSLEGRVAVIFGLANKRSIAWAIAQKLHAAGAQIAITYQNERLRQEAEEMITALPGAAGFQCDVTSDEQIEQVFAEISKRYNGKIHTLVHSVAFAPADDLKNDFLLTTRDGFRVAHDISAYSLIAVSRAAAPLMTEGGSIITLTFMGSERVMLHYNVMGVAKAALEASVRYLAASLGPRNVRVNAISAGPIKTLAARGIGNLTEMLKLAAEKSPLKRNVDPLEVGDTAVFLASDAGAAITGEVIHVDCGYHIMGY
jgi:enoyl-[acyl-carrier protein] reductase I